MTDKEKLDRLVAEIERLYHQSLVDENRQAELGLSSAACTSYGKSKVCKELLSFTDSMQKEPKECMYSKDNYTDEDRKDLCDGCEEKCKFNKKKEPVNVDLKEAARNYGDELDNVLSVGVDDDNSIGEYASQAFKAGANWQKEQMMAKAVDAVVKIDAGGYPYIDSTIELYDYDKDIPLAKRGDKVKILVIRES